MDHRYRGIFTVSRGLRTERVPNILVKTGGQLILRQSFRGVDDGIAPTTGLFWVGLTRVVDSDTITLADCVNNEPTTAYPGRQSIERSAVGWPTELDVNDKPGLRSKQLSFAVTGAWDKPVTRPFLCDVETGAAGRLFALGSPLTQEIQPTEAGDPILVFYEMYIY